ncbi:MAG: hypothetical protein EOP59_10075 [Sphingomonadales bacterium]|nr:MAG: hypothetical protein EOP59_10075 [Sphingomonadales bacterium]
MRIGVALISIAAMAAPAAAQAQGKAIIAMGTEVTLALEGTPGASKPSKITPDAFETETGAQFAQGEHQDAMGPVAKPLTGTPRSATPGLVRLRLTPIAGDKPGSLLVIANGYDRAFTWQAQIRVAGKMQPTDVCVVMPKKSGVEHWPYAVERIVISKMRLEPWKPEDGVRCK